MLTQHASSSAPLEDKELEADPEAVTVNPKAQQSSSSAPLEDKELEADPEAVTVKPDVQQDTLSTPIEDRAGGRQKGNEYESSGTKGVFEHTLSRQGWTQRRNHQSSQCPLFNKKRQKSTRSPYQQDLSPRNPKSPRKRIERSDRYQISH